MTNKEIIQNIHPDFYNKRAHVRMRVLLGFEVEQAMNAARKDEAIAFGEFLKTFTEMQSKEEAEMPWDSVTLIRDYTTEQLYELFKKEK